MNTFQKFKRAVFFDRDGVIVKPIEGDAPKKITDLELIEEIIPTIKKTKLFGFLNIIVSNQPDIALGKIDEKTREKLENCFKKLIKESELPIDDIYYCYHHENSINPMYPKNCDCRKPKPGMILRAAAKHQIDLSRSFMIGDRWKDVAAGNSAGCTTILLRRPWSEENKCEPNYIIDNLNEMLDIVRDRE